jgi:hypothetical protein
VSYFKPFKTFIKVRDAIVSKNNHMEPNKIIMGRWVDHAINQSLMKKNIKARFKATGIWPFNPKAWTTRFDV